MGILARQPRNADILLSHLLLIKRSGIMISLIRFTLMTVFCFGLAIGGWYQDVAGETSPSPRVSVGQETKPGSHQVQRLIDPQTGRDITGEYIAQRLKELDKVADEIINRAVAEYRAASADRDDIYQRAYAEIHQKLGMGSIGPATAAAGPLMARKKARLAEMLDFFRPPEVISPEETPRRNPVTPSPLPVPTDEVTASENPDHRFPDYTPKRTPDTMLDYRPDLQTRQDQLPPATLEALPVLLDAFETHQRLARQQPGEWVEGNVILGADPHEYHPSDEELLVSEIGKRIRLVVSGASKKDLSVILSRTGTSVREIIFGEISFRHVDVMGSGRFFYASEPKPIRIDFRGP